MLTGVLISSKYFIKFFWYFKSLYITVMHCKQLLRVKINRVGIKCEKTFGNE
jgi:hypothetical protein